jgi:hypothetical protein
MSYVKPDSILLSREWLEKCNIANPVHHTAVTSVIQCLSILFLTAMAAIVQLNHYFITLILSIPNLI